MNVIDDVYADDGDDYDCDDDDSDCNDSDSDCDDSDSDCDDDHFGEDNQPKVNAGEHDLQTQRRAMGLASKQVSKQGKDQASPMAGPGLKKMPSKRTPARSKTPRKSRHMRTRTMKTRSITQLSKMLKMTKMLTTDV